MGDSSPTALPKRCSSSVTTFLPQNSPVSEWASTRASPPPCSSSPTRTAPLAARWTSWRWPGPRVSPRSSPPVRERQGLLARRSRRRLGRRADQGRFDDPLGADGQVEPALANRARPRPRGPVRGSQGAGSRLPAKLSTRATIRVARPTYPGKKVQLYPRNLTRRDSNYRQLRCNSMPFLRQARLAT